jgi:hypothetical protein
MCITRRQTNTLTSERDSILHHLGTLQSQESRACHPPAPSPSFRLAVSPDEEDLACDFCASNQHLTTECPHTPDLVYDHAETPPRARRPGESVGAPASWPSLHQATLHYLVTNVIRYYRVVHNSIPHRRNLLRLITELLDLPTETDRDTDALSDPNHLGPTVSTILEDFDQDSALFHRAVAELVPLLRASPFTITDETDPLLRTLCERYYSPLFGRTIDEYRVAVYSLYSTGS